MATGSVKSYNMHHGYGFITPDDGSPELTVYHDSILAPEPHELTAGQHVEYDATIQEFRPVAERVRITD
ncbi:cold-shock protein [Kitasatospora sp. NPDC051853]|uniref:cold-shock protein n=1 Tax=Kitasatospora sp. NPDC051853 TaxID=3364058 RepID=UPI0037A88682